MDRSGRRRETGRVVSHVLLHHDGLARLAPDRRHRRDGGHRLLGLAGRLLTRILLSGRSRGPLLALCGCDLDIPAAASLSDWHSALLTRAMEGALNVGAHRIEAHLLYCVRRL